MFFNVLLTGSRIVHRMRLKPGQQRRVNPRPPNPNPIQPSFYSNCINILKLFSQI